MDNAPVPTGATPHLPANATIEASNARVEQVPVDPNSGQPRPEPAAVPPQAPPSAPAEPSAQPPQQEPAKPPPRPFDPQKLDHVLETWPEEATSHLKDTLGVTALECRAARAEAATKYGLTQEQAANIPGNSAAEIEAAASFAASLKPSGATPPEQTQQVNEPAPVQGAPLPTVAEIPVDGKMKIPAEYLG